MEFILWLFLLVLTSVALAWRTCAASDGREDDVLPEALPEGNTGIAAKYPGDGGIDQDSEVVFADGFEDYSEAADLRKKWDVVRREPLIHIVEQPANPQSGGKALQFTVPHQGSELTKKEAEISNVVAKLLEEERDVLFLRYYSMFEPDFDHVRSSHNGGRISAHYFPDGIATPGIPADGRNKFLAGFENWRPEADIPPPGLLGIYCYHPEQRGGFGDHFFPSGKVVPDSGPQNPFGQAFVSRPDIIPDRGRWYCFEFMVKANTVGQRNGRIACWLDGKLCADFPNLRLRDVEALKIDRFGVGLHIGHNSMRENRKWYDDIVAATSYIGPVAADR